MSGTSNTRHSLRPSLLFSGILLFIAGALSSTIAICSFVHCTVTGHTIAIASTVFYYIGIAAVILPLFLIGDTFKQKKKETNLAIVLLILFLGADLVIFLVPNIAIWGNGWGGMAVFAIYGILRLAACIKIYSSLNIPKNKFGSPFWVVFGGSHLVVTVLTVILAVISGFISDYYVYAMLLEVAFWANFAQFCIDALSFIFIGIKFLIDGSKKPIIEGTGISRVTPASGTYTEQEKGYFPLQQPIQSTSYESPAQEEEVLKYCSYCGAQSFKDNRYCENCGKKLE